MSKRIILSGGIAKRLLGRGHILADVKAKNENPKESCFVFFADKFLALDIDDIMQNKSNDNIAISKRLEQLGCTEIQYKKIIFEEYLNTIQ